MPPHLNPLQAGVHNVTIYTAPAIVITQTPLTIHVHPAALARANSSMVVAPPPTGGASGGAANVTLTLRDEFGNARPNTEGAELRVVGGVTGVASAPLAPAPGAPGVFTYTHPLVAVQATTFTLLAWGAPVGASFALAEAGAAPNAVNFTASLAAATVYIDATDPAQPRPPIATGGAPLAAEAWHTARVPALRVNVSAGRFIGDPRLNATLRVTPLAPNGTREEARTATFASFWSWTGGDYAIPFKLSAPGLRVNTTFAARLTLSHPAGPSVRAARARARCVAARACSC